MNEAMTRQPHLLSIPSELLAGFRDTIPLIVGAIPFGLIFGTLSGGSGLSPAGAMAMSAFVFAGSAQFIAIGLLATGTGWPLIVLTTLVVNLRHLLYAASLLPHVKHLSQFWRVPLAFWLTDETFVVVINRYNQPDPANYKHWYYLASAVAMYISWQFCTWLGLTFGRLMPDVATWGLDFAMSVTFIGMIIPYLKSRPMWVAVLLAGVTALLAQPLPHKLGLMVATLAGISGGLIFELVQRKEN